MCELFGYSGSTASRLTLPLRWFQARGGEAADNRDGWGIAWRGADGLQVHKEPVAAAGCKSYDRLAGRLTSDLAIAHVRKANPPTARVLANTHPFRRACCGRAWVFAHNGILPGAAAPMDADAAPLCAPIGETATAPSLARGPRLDPIGDTDSEHAFCMVLDRIAAAFSASDTTPERGWLDALARTAETFASRGRFNFLMSDGVHLIAYGHDRLHGLDEVGAVVIATEPLTASPGWRAFEPGELRVYRAGRQIASFLTYPRNAVPPSGQDPGATAKTEETAR
jgi:glutamine amidotransferase